MTAADHLLRVGHGTLFAGFHLWIILFFVALFRDPDRSDFFGWSISAQWTAMFRNLRRAAGFRWWGRLAMAFIAFGVTCLLLAGILGIIRLYLEAPKG